MTKMSHMRQHPAEFELALYSTGDLSLWKRAHISFHLSGCPHCRAITQAYRSDRAWIGDHSNDLPEGVNWDRLSREMTANIRVGLAAGECVAPRERSIATRSWRPLAAAAGLMAVVTLAWWLNVPAAQNGSLMRALSAIAHRTTTFSEDPRPRVEISPSEIRLVENGGSLSMIQGNLQPVGVSLNTAGSASAHYVDTDTRQVTITSVYVQ